MGYRNKIRRDFPDVFSKTATIERMMNVAILKEQVSGERRRVFLDELNPNRGRHKTEHSFECGPECVNTVGQSVLTASDNENP